MNTITTHDLTGKMPDILAALSHGEQFVVTDAGKPVAFILPPTEPSQTQLSQDEWMRKFNVLTAQIKSRAHIYAPGGIDDSRESIYEGRC